MLETIVISFAVVISLAILALLLYAARQADLNLERRFESAEAGGRPLSFDERSAAKRRGWDRVPPKVKTGGWYARYRRRNALTRFDLLYGVLLCVYIAVYIVVVGLVVLPLAIIAMYLLTQAVLLGVFLLAKRRASTRGSQ